MTEVMPMRIRFTAPFSRVESPPVVCDQSGKARGDRGIALVVTLLLLTLMSVLGLAMVLTTGRTC